MESGGGLLFQSGLNLRCLHIVLMLKLLFFTLVSSDCNLCHVDSEIACVSENEYRNCIPGTGTAEGPIYKCKCGSVCSISGCTSLALDPKLECSAEDCRKCDETRTFACKNTFEFVLCLGTNTLYPIEGSCAAGYVCNINNNDICGDPNIHPATCPYTLDPTPTPPSASTDPQGFCKFVKEEGRYPVGSDLNTTCRQFLQCILHNAEWFGAVYYCPGGTYFNSEKKNCYIDPPTHCSSTVRRLTLLSLSRE